MHSVRHTFRSGASGHHRVERTRSTAVAVVGGGAAGIATAYYLTQRGLRVELFEAASHLGGNCRRIAVPQADGSETMLDLGVSDFNRETFHLFDAFLTALDVEVRPICEDAAALTLDGATAWSSLGGRFTLASGRAATERLTAEIRRFVATAPEVLAGSGPEPLGPYLKRMGYSEAFATLYARPRAAGCIVMPSGDPEAHDLRSLVRFWQLHGLVGSRPRRRMHVVGGMWTYCDAFAEWFRARGGALRTSTQVRRVTRGPRGVQLAWERPGERGMGRFDHVVLATDAAAVTHLVGDVDDEERRALESVRFEPAEVVVHRDARLMPRDRSAWGAYQFYVRRPGEAHRGGPSITFYPHRLAGLAGAEDVFVSVNPPVAPRDDLVLSSQRLVHPVAAPAASRPDLFEKVQGRRGTWYAGAYLEAPWLHEQAFRSGWRVAEAIAGRAARRPVGAPAAFALG